MNLLILRNLKENLKRRYNYFKTEDLIIDSFEERNPYLYIYSPLRNFSYLSEYRLNQIIKYITTFLTQTKQEGFFYIGGSSFEIKRSVF